MWFSESDADRVGRISTAGAITEFPLAHSNSEVGEVTAGPDGALWFTEDAPDASDGRHIGRITTTGAITEFVLPKRSIPIDIAAGPDGALWFTDLGTNSIGRLALH
jgi:virginiamycin B lyase